MQFIGTSIAVNSYHPGPVSAFFPLYPLAIAGVNVVLGSPLVAGIAISLASFAVALYLLHRLVTIELGGEHARTSVMVMAFFPTALFFSMVYPEALLLALTIGAVYSARTGHWARAGILGALASATHNSGVLVAIPIALLYLYGPRADRDPPSPDSIAWWRPRHLPRLSFLWLLLVPLGLVAFLAYMQVEFNDALRPLRLNETIWHRHFELVFAEAGIRPDSRVDAAIDAIRAYHNIHNLWETVPDEVRPALVRLRKLGLCLAVVSNANGTVADAFERVGLSEYVDMIIDSHYEGIEKPDPRLFQIALERAGAQADMTVHLGDLFHVDVMGARAAGIRAVLLDPAGLYHEYDCQRVGSLTEFVDRLEAATFGPIA